MIMIPVFLTVPGCASQGSKLPQINNANFDQASADEISDFCGAERDWLQVHESGEVRFRPPAKGNYEASLCILKQMRESGVTKFGFVGAENIEEAEIQ